MYSYTPSIRLHWHKWQCAADEISVLFDWKPFDSKHISSLSSTPSSAFSLLGSLINSTWLSAKTALAINLVILIKAGKVHCTQWLNLVKTALSLPTKRHITQQHSISPFRLKEGGKEWSGLKVFDVKSDILRRWGRSELHNICKYLCTWRIPRFAKTGVLWVSALQGSAPCLCTMSMDTWNSSVRCLSLWVFAQVLCWIITFQLQK